MPQETKIVAASEPIRINAGLIIFLGMVLLIIVAVHQHLEQQFDFGVFYYAAHMIVDGKGHELYNLATQHLYQLRFHRPPDTLFRYPPIALIPILPLTTLSMPVAFAVWTATCMGFLIVSIKVFEQETGLHFGNWPILLGILFVPVLDCLLHGQYSILIVMFYALAYRQLRKGQSFWGGALLGLATLKFQLVLGFVPIFLLKRKWRELAGFSASTAVLVAVSLMMTGIQALHQYPNFALHAELPLNELPHKANWQGLLSFINQQGSIWVALLSILTIIWAARAWTNLERGFCAASLAAMLVSYHITPQDLSLAIVPFFVAVNAGILKRERVPMFTAIGMGILLLFMMVQIPMALFALVLAAALVWVGIHRPQVPTESSPAPAVSAV
ncbi:MAG TPA: glycosyltransferase family 87 protein [Terracidiphilus sp.]|nr:glycosyltransferase family 87 protein [Terracidiphilus sp.]